MKGLIAGSMALVVGVPEHAGIDRFIRDVIQQHTNQDTGSKSYDRADYLPQMREAMYKWEKWLDVVIK